MRVSELQNVHRVTPDITPVSTWLLTRIMIGASATMTLTTFAYLFR